MKISRDNLSWYCISFDKDSRLAFVWESRIFSCSLLTAEVLYVQAFFSHLSEADLPKTVLFYFSGSKHVTLTQLIRLRLRVLND